MARRKLRAIAIALAVAVGGCAGVPQLDLPSPFTVAHIIDQIQCEIGVAAARHPRLIDEQWVAVADLTLIVDDSVGLAPKVSFIRPFEIEGTNFTFGAGAELKRARQRMYTETINLSVNNIKTSSCDTLKDSFDLTGDLGIVETVDIGLSSYDRSDAVEFPVTEDKKAAFGHTIQFVLTKNVTGVGPTWTFVHFIGPGGILNAERVDTHKLIISFAQGVRQVAVAGFKTGRPFAPRTTRPVSGLRVSPRGAGAIERASEQNQKMLLQSLPIFRSIR